MDCPRCTAPGVTSEQCPRCGVIVAKVRARPTPAPPLQVEPVEEASGGISRATLVMAGAALLALGVILGRSKDGEAPRAPESSSAARSASDGPASVDTEPPPNLAPVMLPALTPPPPIEPSRVGEADRKVLEEMARRMLHMTALQASDLATAEDLWSRYPDEPGLRELLETVLVALATEDHRKRQFAQAVTRLERAAVVQPASLRARLALLQVQTDAADWRAAEAAARAALALDPRHPDAWRGLGYALLRQDKNREAADALRTALDIRSDGQTQALLDRVAKGLADEGGMREQHLSHFNVRYDGDTHEAVGREILRALERHYATLAAALDHQPATTIPVILFSRAAYYNASGAPAWSGGVYDSLDGRIRLPIGGLTSSLGADMDGTLIHELTHAFVADRTRGTAPREVHEGLAQYMEGRRVGSDLTKEQVTALADGRIGGVMGYYLSALSFVEHLIALRGLGGMNDLLKAMGETGNVDEAFQQVHGTSMRGAQQAWAERLRRQHGS